MHKQLLGFQKAKSASETESEPILHSGVHNLNGVDPDHASRGVEPGQSSQTTMTPQVYSNLFIFRFTLFILFHVYFF